MRRFGSTGSSSRPDELAIVIVDVRSWIEIPVRCEEDVPWSEEFRAVDIEVDDGCVEVWTGFELVSGRSEVVELC